MLTRRYAASRVNSAYAYVFRASKKLDSYQEFLSCISDILANPIVRGMDQFSQHGDVSTFEHCRTVAYFNFLVCKRLHLDARSAARAGLLHDFFLYDWHEKRKDNPKLVHTYGHPKLALANAEKYFDLNATEREIIAMHMWPMVKGVPHHPESYCTALVDKYCAVIESLGAWHSLQRRRTKKLLLGQANQASPSGTLYPVPVARGIWS